MLEKWTSFRPNLFQQIFFSFGRSARVYFLGAKCFLSVELMNVQLLFWDLFNLQIRLWILLFSFLYDNKLEYELHKVLTQTCLSAIVEKILQKLFECCLIGMNYLHLSSSILQTCRSCYANVMILIVCVI